MSAMQQALVRAGVVDRDAADWAAGRDGTTPRTQAPSMADSRKRWLAETMAELRADPTSETARRLIREAHERYDDRSDEFRRFLRPLYTERDRIEQAARDARRQLTRRAR